MAREGLRLILTVNLVSFRGKKTKQLYTVKNNDVQSQNSTDCCNMKHSPISPAEYKIHNVNDIATLTSF